jgi:hypothetical protein
VYISVLLDFQYAVKLLLPKGNASPNSPRKIFGGGGLPCTPAVKELEQSVFI